MAHDIGHDRRDIRTRGEYAREALERQATDGHQWDRPDPSLHCVIRSRPAAARA